MQIHLTTYTVLPHQPILLATRTGEDDFPHQAIDVFNRRPWSSSRP